MHFMNPVPVMQLVEVIRGLATSQETWDAVEAASPQDGQDPGRGARRPRLRLQPGPDADDQRGDLLPLRGGREGGGHRRGYEARDEPSDGPPGAGRPDRPRRLPRHPARSCSRGSAIPSTAPARCWSRWSTPAVWAASRAAASIRTEKGRYETRMYCQVCGAPNRDDHEFCVRCHQKLLVLSGSLREEEEGYEEGGEESFSFDEHLLERISILEEAVKRTAETVRQLLGALHKQEKNILINQTGLSALRELLEQKKYIGWDEWSELWESKMDYQLLALEKRERFLADQGAHRRPLPRRQAEALPPAPGGRRVRPLRLRHRARGGGPRSRLQARPRQLRARLLPRRDPLQRGRTARPR